jgi:hypothetical protein
MIRLAILFVLLLSLLSASLARAQQTSPRPPPAWQDLAIEAQKNATLDQISANAIIASLQAEIATLKAELAKTQAGGGPTKPPDKSGGPYNPPKGAETPGG